MRSRAKAKYSDLLESSEDPVWSVDLDYRLTLFNGALGEQLEAAFGVRPAVGMLPGEMLPAQHASLLPPLYERARMSGCFRIEFPWGDGRNMELSFNPILKAGKATGISVFGRHIAAGKRDARTLAESAARLGGLFDENGSVALLIEPASGIIVDANRSASVFYGYAREQLVGMSICQINTLPPEAIAQEQKRALREERNYFSFKHRLASGEERDVEVYSSPVNADGERLLLSIVHDVSERRDAEAQLRDSEERYRATFEQAAIGILHLGLEGRILRCNPRFAELLGYTTEEVVGFTAKDITAEEDLPGRLGVLERIAGGVSSSESYERRYLRKDGRPVWARSAVSMQRDGAGRPLHFIIMVEDIDAWKQSEIRLQEAAERLTLAVRAGGVGIFVFDIIHNLLVWDEQMFSLYGIAKDRFVGAFETWQSGLHPEDRQRGTEEFNAALRGEKEFDTEFRVVWPDGSVHSIRALALVKRDAAGKAIHMVGTNWEITAQKLYERQLLESEERFRTMADSCPSIMWVADAHANLEFINRVCRQFIGAESNHLMAEEWMSLLHPDDAPGFKLSFTRAVEERVPFRLEHRVRRADGDWRLMGTTAQPRLAPSGEFVGYIGLTADITERRKEEEAREFQHSLMRTIQEVSQEGILVVDGEGNVVSYNEQLFEVWRIPRTQFSNMLRGSAASPVEPLFAAALESVKDPDTYLRLVRDLYASSQAKYVCELELKDGRTLEMYSTSLRNKDGQYLARAWFYRDISEREQAVKALQSSEEKFRQLAENVSEVFWIKDAGCKEFVYVSPAYERVFERSCASIHQDPETRLEAIHPSDRQRTLVKFSLQMQGVAADVEYRILTPSGQEKWVRDRAFPIRDGDGRLIRLVGIVEDISERKRHEAEFQHAWDEVEASNRRISIQNVTLEHERNILRAFMDNVPELMYVKDIESRFVVANAAVARLMGVEKPEDLIGKTDFDFYPPELAGVYFEDEQRVILSGQPLIDHEGMVRASGTKEVRYLLTTKVPLFEASGYLTGIAGIGRDITASKEAEAALRESNRQLRETTDRANELALKAGAANEAKSRFLANMSHEIRTPMNGVIGMNQLLLETDLSAEQRRFVEVAQTSGRALLALIDNILDWSKIEAGKINLEYRAFDLRQTVQDVVEILRVQASGKNLHIDTRISTQIPAGLRGDAFRLRQVLVNLLANAIKFTQRGGIALHAELDSLRQRSAVVRFTVADTGIGITADQISSLFSPFVQADVSTTRKYGGTGLGLAISKQIVERMGGNMGVDSTTGQGTTFWFTAAFEVIPGEHAALGEAVRVVAGASHTSAPTPRAGRGQGEKVLVVEDNFTNREVILAQLKMMGYEARAVENGEEALEAVASGGYALVLMDCEMPVMDGYEASRRIRQSREAQIPIVALTANAMSSDREKCLQAGMNDYLAKPVELQQLGDALARWVPSPHSASPAGAASPCTGGPAILVFDEAALLRRMMGERRIATVVLKGFIDDAPHQMHQMRVKLDAGDAPGVRLQAHTLKGSAATVAAETLHATALEMETAARGGQLDECRRLLPSLGYEFERFLSVLRRDGWL
jgi:PAS domain S-box-containing protein